VKNGAPANIKGPAGNAAGIIGCQINGHGRDFIGFQDVALQAAIHDSVDYLIFGTIRDYSCPFVVNAF
jgi:hypothetical protein